MNEQQMVEALRDAANNLGLNLWAVARRLDKLESDVAPAFAGGQSFTVELLVRVADSLELEVDLHPAPPKLRRIGPVPSFVDLVVQRLTPHLVESQSSSEKEPVLGSAPDGHQIKSAPTDEATYVFLDTEFLPDGARPPVLLSIGLCTLSGAEFYGELAHGAGIDSSDDFLRTQVLPQLGKTAAAEDLAALGEGVGAWLDGLGQTEIHVCYDYHADYDLLEEMLRASRHELSVTLIPTHVGYLNEDIAGELAARQCFAELERDRGLKRHHALADALALQAKFVAIHGT